MLSRFILGKRGLTPLWELRKPSSVNRLWPSIDVRKLQKRRAAAGCAARSEMPTGWILMTIGLASIDQSTGAPFERASSIRCARVIATGNSPAVRRFDVLV